VGPLGTNSYIFGSNKSKEVVIIDVGGEPETFISVIEEKLHIKPIGLLLTHGHYDHTLKLGKLLRHFNIPLMYNKKEFDSGIYTQKKADRWLSEGDSIKIGEITLNVLETPGHSPGALSYYSKEPKEYDGQKIDGIIFTGDLIIKNKIMYNPEITDNFLIFPGHMNITSVGEERKLNMFKNYFLKNNDN